ncbi:Galactoside 2-alpha-L-fucosyltransferase 1 [Amphibalanus amphitrite]|uniref:Galactoside 2-alpha-L-fucosyltransferase 1 n=1 Tax=Amphibalanus amphitrite TaxID=1232801 RepID=A0A6A4X943_AMPAM|nr:Galactoside 2-alpha-L-fucosyltransferase 1 [Amphibalanus amphitrite]
MGAFGVLITYFMENLSGTDIYLLGDPRSEFPGVERDLALLAACNHTIFDYGTYGFFAAFLAGQRVGQRS